MTIRSRKAFAALALIGLATAALAGCAALTPDRAPLEWRVEGLSPQAGPEEITWSYVLVIANPGRIPATLFQETLVLSWDGVTLAPETDRKGRVVGPGMPLRLPVTSVFRRGEFEASAPGAPGRPPNAPLRTDGMAITWQFLGQYEGGGAIILNVDVLPRRPR